MARQWVGAVGVLVEETSTRQWTNAGGGLVEETSSVTVSATIAATESSDTASITATGNIPPTPTGRILDIDLFILGINAEETA